MGWFALHPHPLLRPEGPGRAIRSPRPVEAGFPDRTPGAIVPTASFPQAPAFGEEQLDGSWPFSAKKLDFVLLRCGSTSPPGGLGEAKRTELARKGRVA